MTRTLILAGTCAVLAGCAKAPGMAGPQAPSLAPSSNVFLRNSFDTDPSSYLGRFVPEGLAALDESAGMELACSRYISTRFVEGGGVKYSEYLATSSEVSARLGVPLIASAKGGGGSSGLVRVEYTLTGKLIAEVDDPVAFNRCCTQRPDQCTTRYIGEFLQGTGAVYHVADRGARGKGGGATPEVSGDLAFDHGVHWERAVEFPNPVYFAFKTAGTTHEQPTGTTCTDWNAELPEVPGRAYVVGVTRNPAKTESAARNRALINAGNLAVTQGLIQYPDIEHLGDEDVDWGPDRPYVTEDWCVERIRTDKGDRYIAKVLAWVPGRPTNRRGGPPPGRVGAYAVGGSGSGG